MAKKTKCPEFENHERWLVSYADMVTLLFAVFVVLYSLNLSSSSKQDQATGSMQESFNTPLEEIPPDVRVGPTEQGFGIFDHLQGNSSRQPAIMKYPNAEMPVKVIDSEMARVKVELEDRLYGPNKFRDPNKAGNERIVEVVRTQHGFNLRLLARHFFESGSYHIRHDSLKEMGQVAQVLKELGRPIQIEGHTDSLPTHGQFSNWELSALRSTSVLHYFIGEEGFPASRISAAGYGDQRPIAHNGTEAGRSMNRRIEIHIDYAGDSAPDTPP